MRGFKRDTARRWRWAAGLLLAAAATAAVRTGGASASAPPPGFQIVAHPENPASVLGREFLAAAFLEKATRWPDGKSIDAVDLRFGNAVRRRFSERVLRRSVFAVRSYWQQRIFSGRGVPPPQLDSDDAVLRYVRARRGAIGYVSQAAATSGVKVIGVR